MDYRRALLAAAVAATAANADDYFTGDGTAYTLGSLSSGNCNMMMSGYSSASTNYAAINSEQWNSLANCGRCAEVSCDDSKCSDTTTSVVVQILDQCPECKYGDLDLSPSVFKTITGSDPARYSIKWKFVDCPVSGNVNYCLKSGSNAYWTAVQPANFVTGVASMTINGAATTMLGSAYYYLLDGASTKQTDLSAVTISVTDVNGQTITDTVSLSDSSCTAGSSQFSSSGSSGTTTYTQPKSSTPTPTTAAPTSAPVTTTSAPAPSTAAPTPAPSPSTAAPTSAPTPTTAAPTSAPATTAPPTYSDESVSPATTAPAYTPAPETISPDLSVSTSTPVPVTPAPESTYNFDSIDQSDASDSEADSKADTSGNASGNGTTTYTTRTPTSTTKAPSTSSVSEDADSQKENTEAPTPTPTSEAQKQPTSSSSGGAQEANTQSGGGSGSSAVIGSIAAAACAVIVAAVAVVVIQKKKKAMEERKAGEEDAELASSHLRMRSFDLQRMSTPANQQNVAMMQNEPHRSDLAIL